MNIDEIFDKYAGMAHLKKPPFRINYNKDLHQFFNENHFLMAPMAGVSDSSYRLMAYAGGASLAYTEMVSVTGLRYGSKNTWSLIEPHPPEDKIAVQLFGKDAQEFAAAASQIQNRLQDRLALIDINMACPVPKVVKKGEGSALLDEPDLASEIVKACSNNCNVPVTAKIRIGRRQGEVVAPDFAKVLEAAGVSAVAVHGRFASEFYKGISNSDEIKRVVEAVHVPVIASGDVFSAMDAALLLHKTGASAMFCARGTYGNPWIFSDAQKIVVQNIDRQNCIGGAAHSLAERMAAFAMHVLLLEACGGRISRARSLAAWYIKDLPDAAYLRNVAMKCKSVDEYLDLIDSILSGESHEH